MQAAAPFVPLEGMIQSGRDLHGVMVHGVDPAWEDRLSGDMMNMVEGSLETLEPGAEASSLVASWPTT